MNSEGSNTEKEELILPLTQLSIESDLVNKALNDLADRLAHKEDKPMKTYIRIAELVRVVLGEEDENYELVQNQYIAHEDRHRARILNVHERLIYIAEYTEDELGLHFTDFVNGFTVNQNDFNTVIQLGEER